MAERRMFAKTIIDSDAFLDMPLSTQALYFHLGMRADDDGFVNNPKKILRMISSSEDDLKLLITKKFIIPFDSGVVVIKHWRMHNYIQKDRYIETKYKEEKATLFLDENKAYTQNVSSLYPECIQFESVSETQVRLGKDSIELDNTSKEVSSKNSFCPYEEIVKLFNETCTKLSKVTKITDSRKRDIRARWKEYEENIDVFKDLFEKTSKSDFLCGKNDRKWKAKFDWLMNPNNFIKVLEGNYENSSSQPRRTIDDLIRERRERGDYG